MSQSNHLSVQHVMLTADSSQLTLKIAQADSIITREDIVCLLQNPALPRYKLNIDGVNEAVAAFASLREANETNTLEFEPIVIADKHDAHLEIIIDDDKMTAAAKITVAYGGEPITLADIKNRCDQLGIKFGLSPAYVLKLLNICKDACPGKVYTLNIAKGTAPIDGEDANFKKIVNTDNHHNPVPTILPNGNVDMLNLGQSLTVQAGTLLMKKTPVILGEPGKTVTAEVVNQQQGIDHPFIINKNVQVDPNNPLHLVATSYGLPIDKKGFISIDDVLLIEDVDNKRGHIDYDGTIVITGDVHEGMKVTAKGDVTVMGMVDSAQIICGGDLTVHKAIIGHHQKNTGLQSSCNIECQGNLTGSIAQYASLTVGKDLLLSNQLMHCETQCNGSIKVHDQSMNKGTIIGGTTTAYNNVVTTIIGTSGGTKTSINLIGELNELEEIKSIQIQELNLVNDTLDKIKQQDRKVESILDIAERKKAKRALSIEKQQYRDSSDQIQSEMSVTKQKIEECYKTTFVTATKKLFSDTNITLLQHSWTSNQEFGPSVIAIINRSLQLTPYQKPK